jgi:uncharacterized membrane protein YkvI
MKNNILKILKIGFLFAASVAGAGFASGKEVMVFFTRFSNLGIYGITLCGILLIAYFYICMILSISIKSASLYDFLDHYFGRFSLLFGNIIIAFMFVVFSVMICGAGQLIHENTGVNYYICGFIFIIFIIWSTGRGLQILQKVSVVLMGTLFISIIVFSLFILKSPFESNRAVFLDFFGTDSSWKITYVIWQSVTYCGYNALLATSSIIGISEQIINKSIIFAASIIGGLIFVLPSYLMHFSMLPYVDFIGSKDFPFIYLVEIINDNLGLLYSFIVFLAMTLSAIINGYYLRKINFIFLPCAYLMLFTGFSEIIAKIYPVFGVLGIIFLIILIHRYIVIYFELNNNYLIKLRGE